MKKWKLHEAKNKLSQLLNVVTEGKPQCITRGGKDTAVVISIEEYQRLKKQPMDFKEFLRQEPYFDDCEIERVKCKMREIDL